LTFGLFPSLTFFFAGLLPELLAQTNMDVSNTQRMREELSKLSLWLSRNSEKYFRTEYIPAEQSYEDADDSSG
jgi:hypothetical protein